jgi:hypothetical protein
VVNPCGFKEVGCANVYIVSLCFGKLRDVLRDVPVLNGISLRASSIVFGSVVLVAYVFENQGFVLF